MYQPLIICLTRLPVISPSIYSRLRFFYSRFSQSLATSFIAETAGSCASDTRCVTIYAHSINDLLSDCVCKPGTIASAVSLGAQTSIGTILADHTNASDKDIREALAGRRFRIHPTTMKIVMEGEDGYDTARTPQTGDLRRRSVFASFQERIRPMSASLRP